MEPDYTAISEAERKTAELNAWMEEQKRIDALKSKAYKVKSPNQKANEIKASRNRAAKRRRKSR